MHLLLLYCEAGGCYKRLFSFNVCNEPVVEGVLFVGIVIYLLYNFPFSFVELREEGIGIYWRVLNLGEAKNIGYGQCVPV